MNFDFMFQEKNRDLANQQQSGDTDTSPSEAPTYDFTTKFAEAKAQSKVTCISMHYPCNRGG